MDKTICELFAGVGGISLGFFRLEKGWQVTWFNQMEPGARMQHAHRCYVIHNGIRKDKNGDYESTYKDINDIEPPDIPEHSLLVFGSPCQDFSVLATTKAAKGLEGENGKLWWTICEIIREKRPPFILMENVARILQSPGEKKHKLGRDFAVILSSLDEMGYYVEWRKVCAADYGAATKRTSAYIFAYRKDTRFAQEQLAYTREQVILSKGLMPRAFPIDRQKSAVRTVRIPDYETEPLEIELFNFRFGDAGVMWNKEAAAMDVIPARIPFTPLASILEKNAPKSMDFNQKQWKSIWKLKGKAKDEPRVNEFGQDYTYSEGVVPFPDKLDRPARTIVTTEGNVSRCTHVIFVPGRKHFRRLTPVEAERAMGFPDNWTDIPDISIRARYKCMGNAVVVPMITRMAAVIDNIVSQEV